MPQNAYAAFGAASLTRTFATLLSTIKQDHADLIDRLELKCTSLNRDYFKLALAGALDFDETTSSFTMQMSQVGDKLQGEIDLRISTDTVQMMRKLGARQSKTCPSAARCATAKRLAAVRTVKDVAAVFAESVADLASELSDYERSLFGTQKILPKLTGDVFTLTMGDIKLTLDAATVTVKGKLSIPWNDKIPTLVWTYLMALDDARPGEMATMKRALSAWVKELRS